MDTRERPSAPRNAPTQRLKASAPVVAALVLAAVAATAVATFRSEASHYDTQRLRFTQLNP